LNDIKESIGIQVEDKESEEVDHDIDFIGNDLLSTDNDSSWLTA